MSLGGDREICKQAFIEAMRTRLEEEGLGGNVDDEAVQKNLGALGQAIYDILTDADKAETISDSAEDEDFWNWVEQVNDWLLALSSWQQGIVSAFAAWTPTQPPEQSLQAALTALSDPGPPPVISPTRLKGRIE